MEAIIDGLLKILTHLLLPLRRTDPYTVKDIKAFLFA